MTPYSAFQPSQQPGAPCQPGYAGVSSGKQSPAPTQTLGSAPPLIQRIDGTAENGSFMMPATVFVVLLMFSMASYAQTACPQGVGPGDPRCGPAGGANTVAPSQQTHWMRWKLTWGAVALSSTGELGAVTGEFSKRKAEREALRRCQSWGGKDCVIKITYKNQCAAVAWPGSERARSAYASAATADEAERVALSTCNHDGSCRVVYSKCTDPVSYFD